MDEFVTDVIVDDYLAFTNINDKFYEIKKIDEDGMGLSYEYNYNNFSNSYIANNCVNKNKLIIILLMSLFYVLYYILIILAV